MTSSLPLLLLVLGLPWFLLWPRTGLWLVLLFVPLQDAVRKVTPGQPVTFTLVAAAALLLVYLGLCIKGDRPSLQPLWERDPFLRPALATLMGLVVAMAIVTYLRTSSLPLVALGLLTYCLPFVMLQMGVSIGRDRAYALKTLAIFVGVTSVALGCVYLNRFAFKSPFFDEVGVGIKAYAPGVGILDLEPGLYRSAEIAGWHGFIAISALLFFLLNARGATQRLVCISLLGILSLALIWTGRRKYILGVVTVAVVFAVLTAIYNRTSRRGRGILIVFTALALAGSIIAGQVTEDSDTHSYLLRLQQVREDGPGRFYVMAVAAPQVILRKVGFFGSGVGTSSQGLRFVGSADSGGFAAEGGIGQVTAELGVPGLITAIWCLVALMRHFLAGLRRSARGRQGVGRFAFMAWGSGLMLANAVTYATAKQAYGDPFVLCWVGLLAGMVLGAAHWRSDAADDEEHVETAAERRARYVVRTRAIGAR